MPHAGGTAQDHTAVDTPYAGTAVFTPCPRCTAKDYTAVDTPYAGCKRSMVKRASVMITENAADGRAQIRAKLTINGKGMGKGLQETPRLSAPLHEPVMLCVSDTKVTASFEQQLEQQCCPVGDRRTERYTVVGAQVDPPELEVSIETDT